MKPSPTQRRLRIALHTRQKSVATFSVSNTSMSLNVQEIKTKTQQLFRKGITEIITPALPKSESEIFLQAGYKVRENLHLLKRSLTTPLPVAHSTHSAHQARSWHRKAILAIDRNCFDTFWRFNKATLKAAQKATPISRTLLIGGTGQKVGYAIAGKAVAKGYLHRLAVKSDFNNQGYGTALLLESLIWLQKHGAESVFVNTQTSNKKAMHLYEKMDFIREPDGLVVLQIRALL